MSHHQMGGAPARGARADRVFARRRRARIHDLVGGGGAAGGR